SASPKRAGSTSAGSCSTCSIGRDSIPAAAISMIPISGASRPSSTSPGGCSSGSRSTSSLVSGAKPMTPKWSSRTAQGASPGFKVEIAESPERAAQGFAFQLQINAGHKAPHLIAAPLHRPFGASLVTCACSQGASPGFKVEIAESPERAAQGFAFQLQINAGHKAPHLIAAPLHRPFGASVVALLVPRACALGFPDPLL